MVRRIGTQIPTDSWSSSSPARIASTIPRTPRRASTIATTSDGSPTSFAAPPFSLSSPEVKSPRRASISTGSPSLSGSVNSSKVTVFGVAPPLTISPRRASLATGSPTPGDSVNTSKGTVFDLAPSSTKSPRRASISTGNPTMSGSTDPSRGPVFAVPFTKSPRRSSISTGSPTPGVSINSPKGPVFTLAPPLTRSPRRASISTEPSSPGVSIQTWKGPAFTPMSPTASSNVGVKTRAYATPTVPRKLESTGSKPSTASASKSQFAAGSTTEDEIAKVMMTAKPSEIRAAAKAGRAAFKAERERQERMLKDEQAAQMKMNKIRAEIDAIKAKEGERVLDSNGEEIPNTSLRNRSDHARNPACSSSRLTDDFTYYLAEDDPQDSNIEMSLASMEDSEMKEVEVKEMGKRLLVEMETSFAQLSGSSHHTRENELKRSKHREDLPVSTVAMAIGYEPPRRRELRSTKDGHLEKNPNDRPQRPGKGPSNRRPPRTPSNLVPEMRRRASQRDLMFDDELVYTSSDMRPMSTHSPVTGKDLTALTMETKTSQAEQSSTKSLNVKSAHVGSAIPGSPIAQGKNSIQLDRDPNETVSSYLPLGVPLSPSQVNSSSQNNVVSPRQTSPPAALVRNGITAAMQNQIRDPSRLAKMEEEKRKLEAQRKKLDEAREYFQEGHDLCWKFQDSASALGEYRKALFIRESLLGKYHDETGRSYYWIGRSLVKLKEYDEALVAFSRALRIFERVLTRSHKYRKWAEVAISAVFREMDDPDADYSLYKQSLDDSISHERAGDGYRKKKAFALAIAEYRAAIENIEEYHPDAADLYCKIAIILRQQGEFEKALEENRFALEIYELSLGAEHPETVKTLNQTMEKKRLNQVSLALMEKLDLGN